MYESMKGVKKMAFKALQEGVRGLDRGLGAPNPQIANGPAEWGPGPGWETLNWSSRMPKKPEY